MIKKLKRRLARLIEKKEALEKLHVGKEENFTYWGGYELGYIKGKIDEIEGILEILEGE